MYREYPVKKEQIRPFLHRPVGVVMLNGSRHVGVVTGCRNGKLVLNGLSGAERARPAAALAQRRRKRRHSAASVSISPIPPYAVRIASRPKSELELAGIAFLFELLP
jgi:hypothetical protein